MMPAWPGTHRNTTEIEHESSVASVMLIRDDNGCVGIGFVIELIADRESEMIRYGLF